MASYAFSVLWEVTPEATIVDVEFKKSIIHSIAALTYQQAQSLIDKPDKDCRDDIQAGAVKRLASLARKFRERRINAGALTLASPEVKFVLDSESLNPTDVQAYTLYEANALVEEFMLLANVTVAKKILRHYPTLSILRRHPAPNRSMFDGLIQKAKIRKNSPTHSMMLGRFFLLIHTSINSCASFRLAACLLRSISAVGSIKPKIGITMAWQLLFTPISRHPSVVIPISVSIVF